MSKNFFDISEQLHICQEFCPSILNAFSIMIPDFKVYNLSLQFTISADSTRLYNLFAVGFLGVADPWFILAGAI